MNTENINKKVELNFRWTKMLQPTNCLDVSTGKPIP